MAAAETGLGFDVGGKGEPLLLLHPVGLDASFWEPVARTLERSHRVYRLDLPGHGRTPLQDFDPTIRNYADAVASFITSHCDTAPCLIGLSFGGMVGQELALAYPGILERLALCGCTASFPHEARQAVRERGLLARREGMDAVIDSTLERWFTPEFLQQNGASSVRARLERQDPESWAAAWNAISLHDAQPRLGELKLPVLCLAGERDRAAPPDAMRAMASAIPKARFEILPSAPHMMQIETPAAMSEQLAALLFKGS